MSLVEPEETNEFPTLFSIHRDVNALDIPRSHFAALRGDLARTQSSNKMKTMVNIICNCRDDNVVTENDLDIEHWNSLVAKLEKSKNNDYTNTRKRKDIVKAYGSHKRNTLMMVCMLHPPLRVVRCLVEFGGMGALLGECDCGFTALHYACCTNASLEVIQYLLKVGGEEAIMKTTKNSRATPLHTACQKYTGDSLPDVIKHMIEIGKHRVLTAIDYNCEIPLHCMLLRHGGLPVEAIIAYLESWYELEMTETTILSFSNENWQLHPEKRDETCMAFNKTIGQIENISEEEKGKILKTSFMRTFLTRRFIQRLPLAIIMMDLYIQILIVYTLSYSMSNEVTYPFCSVSSRYLLTICVYWRVLREVVQVMTTSLGDYCCEVSNWIDGFQIILIISTINITLDNHVIDTNHVMASDDRIALALATFISWFELLFELHNFIYDLAVFVVATIMVLKHLVPFVFTTVIFVLAFAHTYLIAGPHDENLCKNRHNLTDTEHTKFMEEGGWACTRMDSIEFASNIFFNFDIPSGVPLGITYAFACIMSIFLLNVLVAVISTAFDDVQSECATAFWSDRLRIVDEVQKITSFISLETFFHSSSMLKTYDKENNERFNFNFFLSHSVWSQLASNGDSDSEIVRWWYGKVGKDIAPPPLNKRLSFFFRKSNWNDILCPGSVFENILLGYDRSSDFKGLGKFFTFFCSLILMVVGNALIAIMFISGLASFGLLWPQELKEFLFTVSHLNDEVTGEAEKPRHEDNDTKKEIREMRDAHSRDLEVSTLEIIQLKSEIKKMKKEQTIFLSKMESFLGDKSSIGKNERRVYEEESDDDQSYITE